MPHKRLAYFTVSIIEYLFITLFIYTGFSKLLDLDTFQFQTHRSPYLENISSFVSYTIPTAELLVVLAIVISKFRNLPNEGRIFQWLRKNGTKLENLGLYGALFLMALFTDYVRDMLNKSSYLPCSCGGILSSMSWDTHLVFNSIFTTLAIAGIVLFKILASAQPKLPN